MYNFFSEVLENENGLRCREGREREEGGKKQEKTQCLLLKEVVK